MRIIAAIDIMEGAVVRLVQGLAENKKVYSNSPVDTARKWADLGADMLHIVDLDAALGKGSNSQIINELISTLRTENKTIPIQVAGGLRTPEIVEECLDKSQASKVVIGTMAYSDPGSVKKLHKKYSGRIVVSIDQKGGQTMVKGWQESSGMKVQDSIAQFRSMGIDEFLLTSVDRDGTLLGPDLSVLSDAVFTGARIVASGGVSSVEDVLKVKTVGCSGLILGKALYDGLVTIDKAKAIA